MSEAFQVDLRGVVDLLARHLYSSPRVYLRELLQNGVDAVTARRAVAAEAGQDPAAVPARVRLVPLPDGGLEVRDTGVGLTAAEAAELLATIGRSSKRDVELGTGREEFLGQFGIGLLSAFMVADEIELVSLSARPTADGAAARAVRWRGRADGRYELDELGPDDPLVPDEPGSVVRLRPRAGSEHWLAPGTVTALALDVGELLPVDLAVRVGLDDGTTTWRRLSGSELPWARRAGEADDDPARARRLAAHAERALGFTPLAHVDLAVPVAGVSGVAHVLPAAVSPATPSAHRVYLRRMLLGGAVDDLLPPWAFFVRCVLDASALRPTASREGLYEDDVLLAVREALGEQVRAWVVSTLREGGPTAEAFLRAHHLAVRALALQDDTMLELAGEVLPFESTAGHASLAALAAHVEPGTRILWAPTVEEFRRVAPVAAAQGLVLVNGGYVYDADLLPRLARRFPAWGLSPVTSADVAQVLEDLEPLRELEVLDAVRALDDALADQDCDVVVRRYEPAALPAMLLHDRDGDHERDVRTTVESSDDVWGQVLAGFAAPVRRTRRLVLNDANDTVRALLACPDAPARDAAARSLYVSAVLLSGRPIGPGEATVMTGSLAVLLDRALAPGRDAAPGSPGASGTPTDTPDGDAR